MDLTEELKSKIVAILKPETPSFVFTEDDIITLEIQRFIREQHSSARIRQLFDNVNKNEKRQQPMERICCCCNNIFVKTYSFSQINTIIRDSPKNNNKFVCPNCQNVEKEKKISLLKEKENMIKERTEEYIKYYLDSDRAWNVRTKTWQKIQSLQDFYVDYNEIENYIKNMDYNDFLQTPYWKAIAEKVKSRAKWTCEMCGKSAECLNVHHPDYSFHGRELQNINRLKCLCPDCHEKFHFDF